MRRKVSSHKASDGHFVVGSNDGGPYFRASELRMKVKQHLLIISAGLVTGIEAMLDTPSNSLGSSCGLYLAHADIFDRLGVFTATGLDPGCDLNAYDAVVPLFEDNGRLWRDGTWSDLLGYTEMEGRPMRAMLAGTGSAINLHANLYNLAPTLATHQPDSSGLHRRNDVGVGAFSYQLMKYQVTSSIPPGGQLILNNPSPSGDISADDYRKIDEIVRKFRNITSGIDNDELVNDSLRFIQSSLRHPVADSFPTNVRQLTRVLETGSQDAWQTSDLEVSVPWLQEHGVCLDNIIPRSSGIKQAGRGAFATRALESGSIVAPSPVIPVSRYELSQDLGDDHQLLLNYCYGHPLSSLMLCLYGSPSAYVNHGGHEKANAALRWSTTLHSEHEEFAEMSIVDILSQNSPSLVLELVATRDIEPGEEIFLDYGQDWEYAWMEHESNWKHASNAESYTPASDWNRMNVTTIRTQEEQVEKPYPENVVVGIVFNYYIENRGEIQSAKSRSIEWSAPVQVWQGSNRYCEVLERRKAQTGDEDMYTVRVENHPSTQSWELEYIPPEETITLYNVPRSALHFVDTLGSTDVHLPTAFRNEMHVPFELYPEGWLDMVSMQEEDWFYDEMVDEGRSIDEEGGDL